MFYRYTETNMLYILSVNIFEKYVSHNWLSKYNHIFLVILNYSDCIHFDHFPRKAWCEIFLLAELHR